VTSSQPAICGPSVAAFREIVVTRGDQRSAYLEFARGFIVPRHLTVIADGANLREWGGQSLARENSKSIIFRSVNHVWFQRGHRRDRRCFRHAPSLNDDYSKLLESREQALRRRRSRDNNPHATLELPPCRLPFQCIDDAQPDRGHTAGQSDSLS